MRGKGGVMALRGLAVACAVAALSPGAFAAFDGDWELWTEFALTAPVTDNFAVFVTPQLRYRDFWDEYYLRCYDAGLSFRLSDRWKFEPFYTSDRCREDSGWNHADIISADLYYRMPLSDIYLSDMFAFQNRVRWEFDNDGDRQCVRERVKLIMKVPGAEGVEAFLSNEIIYNTSAGDWKQNRAAIGIGKGFKSGLCAEVGYQLTGRHSDGHWEDANTLLVNFGYTLPGPLVK